jgi:hypothetical protein
MANAVKSADKQIKLRGLRQHQERLFRYFGVGAAEPAEGADASLLGAEPPIAAHEVV